MRLSPYGTFLDANDSDPIPGTRYLVQQLSELGLAYVHLVEGRIVGHTTKEDDPAQRLAPFRQAFKVRARQLGTLFLYRAISCSSTAGLALVCESPLQV